MRFYEYNSDNSTWEKVHEIVEVNSELRPTKVNVRNSYFQSGFEEMELVWERDQLKEQLRGEGDWRTVFNYYDNGLLQSKESIDGQIDEYEYDEFNKLEFLRKRGDLVNSEFIYKYA